LNCEEHVEYCFVISPVGEKGSDTRLRSDQSIIIRFLDSVDFSSEGSQ